MNTLIEVTQHVQNRLESLSSVDTLVKLTEDKGSEYISGSMVFLSYILSKIEERRDHIYSQEDHKINFFIFLTDFKLHANDIWCSEQLSSNILQSTANVAKKYALAHHRYIKGYSEELQRLYSKLIDKRYEEQEE